MVDPPPVRARNEAFLLTSVAFDTERREGEEAVAVFPKEGRWRPVERCLGVFRDDIAGKSDRELCLLIEDLLLAADRVHL